MCFSAEASFTAGTLLLGSGAVATRQAATRAPAWVPVALYPVAFGLQQLAEGLVWLDAPASGEVQVSTLALAFLFFSHGFWPAWAPFSVWWLRRESARAPLLAGLAVAGLAVGVGLFAPLLAAGGVPVGLGDGHVSYATARVYDGPLAPELVLTAYGIVVLAPFALAGAPLLLAFGALIAVAMLVAQLFFAATLISVWCFFAAVISGGVAVALALGARSRTTRPQAGPLR